MNFGWLTPERSDDEARCQTLKPNGGRQLRSGRDEPINWQGRRERRDKIGPRSPAEHRSVAQPSKCSMCHQRDP